MAAGRLGLIAAAAILAAQGAGAVEPELVEIIKRPPHRTAWEALMKGREVPGWVHVFSRTGNGVQGPTEVMERNGRTFRVGHVCKPHDCADNEFRVLFSEDGHQAWAMIRTGEEVSWLGNPSPAIRSILNQ